MTKHLTLVHGGCALYRDLSDDELMLLIEGDQHRPFEEIVARHQPLVLGFTIRFLGDQVEAREITQEVFLTLWAERKRYRPEGKFRSYLLALAVNRCKMAARQRRVAQEKQTLTRDAQRPVEAQLPVDQLLEEERAAGVRARLLDLNEGAREALLLRFFSGLSYEEIARITGKVEGTVRSLVCRGLRQLHDSLPEEYRA